MPQTGSPVFCVMAAASRVRLLESTAAPTPRERVVDRREHQSCVHPIEERFHEPDKEAARCKPAESRQHALEKSPHVQWLRNDQSVEDTDQERHCSEEAQRPSGNLN